MRAALRGTALIALAVSVAGCGVFGDKDVSSTPTIGERTPILSRIESGAKVDPTLADVPIVLPAQQSNAEWAQAGGSASKSYGHLALAPSIAPAWSVQIPGGSSRRRLAAAPVIGAGKLFVYDTAGSVHAFDAQTGAAIWQRSLEQVDGDGRNALFGGGVSFDGGRVFATTGLGEVAALDAQTGAQIWRVQTGAPLRGSPTLSFGSVYVMTQDNRIIAFDAASGVQQWLEAGSLGQSGVFGVAAPAAGQGTVIAGYSSGELIAYRYENGRNLWADALSRTSISTSVGTLTDIDADPIIDSGRVYALGQGGRMAAYELVTGQRIWELNLAGISTPAVAGDWIFTLTDDARMLAISRATGKVRWIAQLRQFRDEKDREDEIFWSGPVLAGGRLWAVNSRGEIWAVDATDGSAVQQTDVGKPVSLAPVVANGTLYVLDDSGRINAFR
ncbi:PQQ-binding-like beta-propeller repeat protein [Croceicoccus sp. F390]|uniref:PQQ-binding-like beta-propeller repeat protein n=2 Tax=Croceicoccus esteveae TaxID=3075597 RepID=A0ABU2ZG42_9SPHN|nr:PQQ-binding-like beta-propeller repeat protein [Croceicoccus sp. F390]MDT0575326.1 PQQ-binding-like beta-propeller repeat protein [Croceicoccus sp. F390]